jgi:hypothetical protein
VQQKVATLACFAQALRCGIAADEKRGDRCSIYLAKISNRRDAGLSVCEAIVADDEIGRLVGAEIN